MDAPGSAFQQHSDNAPASGQPGRAQAVGLDGLYRLFWSRGMSIDASHLNSPIIETPPHPKNHKPKLVAATAAWHTLNVQWAVVKLQLSRASQNAAQTVSTVLHWALLNQCYNFILFSLCKVVELFSEKCLQFFRELLQHWSWCRGYLQNTCPECRLEMLKISLFSIFNIYRVFLSDHACYYVGDSFHQCLFCTYVLAVSNTRIPTKKMMKATPFLY